MNKIQVRGVILLLTGIVLVLCGLGIHLNQQRQDAMAGQNVAILQQVDQKTLPTKPADPYGAEGNVPQRDPQMPEKTYMGYTLIGSVRVPSVGIDLPVLGDWSEEMLKVAPCRYRGSISGGDLIIMGHNYKSHFTPLHQVSVGAEVTFENAMGKVFRYRVAEIVYLHRTEGEQLPSEYPLTIFTCTPGGLERIVVRCEEI